MISLKYKGRIHKAKFTLRSVRYVLSDQAARAFPNLQKRWLFPVESQPVAAAASADFGLPSAVVSAAIPDALTALRLQHEMPLQLTDHVYALENIVITGWAGAMIKDGLLLAVRPQQNWVSALRAHPHKLRRLPDTKTYFNFMAPIPARGHVFHWLFNSVIPLVAFLESGGQGLDLGLIVNAAQSEFQSRTVDYLANRYGITAIEPVGQHEAVQVPHAMASIPVPHIPRALQSPAGLAKLDDLGEFLEADAAGTPPPRRVYVSRSDARLRHVLNENALLPSLEAFGFERVTLSGLPIGAQVRLFRHAEAVIGPHGAGFAHIAWCSPGTKVVEFLPTPHGRRGRVKNASTDYWLTSQMRGLDYSCSLAGPVLNRADGFRIEKSTLLQALEDAGIKPL
jgi:hypothetical protein